MWFRWIEIANRDGLAQLAEAATISETLPDTYWQTRIKMHQIKYRLLNGDCSSGFVIDWIMQFEAEISIETDLAPVTLPVVEATLVYARWQMLQAAYSSAYESLHRINKAIQIVMILSAIKVKLA